MNAAESQQFCVRWNSHLGSLGAAFPQLLAGQHFVDVTLACEGHQLHCHRLVLAACSKYFESLLSENPCKHPIIILPLDIKLWEIQALVDFMYKGEVNVSQAGLKDLLKCAETLQIRGLHGSEAALNLNQINNLTTITSNDSHIINAQTNRSTNFTNDGSNDIEQMNGHNYSQKLKQLSSISTSESIECIENCRNDNNSKHLSEQNLNSNTINIIKSELNLSPSDNGSLDKNDNNEQLDDDDDSLSGHGNDDSCKNEGADETFSSKYSEYMKEVKKQTEKQQCHQTQTEQQQEKQLFRHATSYIIYNKNKNNIYHDDKENLNNIDAVTNDDNDLIIGIISDDDTNLNDIQNNDNSIDTNNDSINQFGKIRVKSKENLFENYNIDNDNLIKKCSNKNISRKLNKQDINYYNKTIQQKKINDNNDIILPIKFSTTLSSSSASSSSSSSQLLCNDDNIKNKTNNMIYNNDLIKNEYINDDNNYENIICSPNVMDITYDDSEDIEDNNIINDNYDDIRIDESIYNTTNTLIKNNNIKNDIKTQDINDYFINNYNINKNNLLTRKRTTVTTTNKNFLKKNNNKNNKQLQLTTSDNDSKDKNLYKDEKYFNGEPTPSAVVLRNPRSNQPRTYSTDALYSALMDVKSGESIYRASQIHKVPRKTLRNWMKRWHIKSAYPMPRQLKQAAEKKKLQQTLSNTL